MKLKSCNNTSLHSKKVAGDINHPYSWQEVSAPCHASRRLETWLIDWTSPYTRPPISPPCNPCDWTSPYTWPPKSPPCNPCDHLWGQELEGILTGAARNFKIELMVGFMKQVFRPLPRDKVKCPAKRFQDQLRRSFSLKWSLFGWKVKNIFVRELYRFVFFLKNIFIKIL